MYVDWKTTPITLLDYVKVKLYFKGIEKKCLKGNRKSKQG